MLILCISHAEVIEMIQETDARFQEFKTNKNNQEKSNTTANKANKPQETTNGTKMC